jgi:hypothetical protein
MSQILPVDPTDIANSLAAYGVSTEIIAKSLGVDTTKVISLITTTYKLNDEATVDRLNRISNQALDYIEETMRWGAPDQKLALSKIILARISASLGKTEESNIGELRQMMGRLVRQASDSFDDDDDPTNILSFPDIDIDPDE